VEVIGILCSKVGSGGGVDFSEANRGESLVEFTYHLVLKVCSYDFKEQPEVAKMLLEALYALMVRDCMNNGRELTSSEYHCALQTSNRPFCVST
jgi:hypothetical protein